MMETLLKLLTKNNYDSKYFNQKNILNYICTQHNQTIN